MSQPLELFGLMLFSHGWARILTVMSPQGTSAVVAVVKPGDGMRLEARKGHLPQFHEIREGALDRLIEGYGITVLDKPEWDAHKAELGESIYL